MQKPAYELVSFEHPPVQEVAFAVQLADPGVTIDFLADLRDALSLDLPVRQLHDPLPRMVETLDGEVEAQVSGRLGTMLPRVWFLSQDGVFLVQVQEDRIALNWRRSGLPIEYPRYESLRPKFEELLDVTSRLLGTNEGIPADFIELTYVNELDVDAPNLPAELALTTIQVPDASFLPLPEDSKWAARWLIPGERSEARGRLIASAEPATRQVDQKDTYLLTMTARFPENATGTPAILECVDLGHEWIVKGFADLTTKQMQERWGRTK